MNEFALIDEDTGNKKHFDSRSEAEEMAQELMLDDYTIQKANGSEPEPGSAEDIDARTSDDVEVIDMDETEEKMKEGYEKRADASESDTSNVPARDLGKDPIGFLISINDEFVNTIKGKDAISKQGFRFIQREFEISTESKVVQWSEDPLGCVVWAKAELPNGYSAEAHGEGYQFESDVSDNEFVRYADTRAKNRALSDLTSAGALAVSELQGEGQ